MNNGFGDMNATGTLCGGSNDATGLPVVAQNRKPHGVCFYARDIPSFTKTDGTRWKIASSIL